VKTKEKCANAGSAGISPMLNGVKRNEKGRLVTERGCAVRIKIIV
jgi:hypothetical protein